MTDLCKLIMVLCFALDNGMKVNVTSFACRQSIELLVLGFPYFFYLSNLETVC